MRLVRLGMVGMTVVAPGQLRAEPISACHAVQKRLEPSVPFALDWMQRFIVGGQASQRPGVIGLHSRSGSGGSCTSSLIAPRAILTSVHCVCDLSAETIQSSSDGAELMLSYYDTQRKHQVVPSRVLKVFPENADRGTRCGSKNMTAERVATDFAVLCVSDLPEETETLPLAVAEQNFEGEVYGVGGDQVYYRAKEIQMPSGGTIPGYGPDYSRVHKDPSQGTQQKMLKQEFETIDVGTPQVRMIARNVDSFSLGDVDAKIAEHGESFPVDLPGTIYPGDSGGPVVSEGKQVGISTQISLPSFPKVKNGVYESVAEQTFLAITPWLKNRIESFASQCAPSARSGAKNAGKAKGSPPSAPSNVPQSPERVPDQRSLMKPPSRR